MNHISRRDILLYGVGGAAFGFSIKAANGAIRNPRCRCGVRTPKNYNKKLSKNPDKWGKTHLTYSIQGRDTADMSAKEWDGEFKLAFDSWSELCPLTFSHTDSLKGSDFIIGVGRRRKQGFGKSGGILAWAQMPPKYNYDGQLWSMFDLAENWILPDEEYGIILRSVAAHEIGHLLGLDHSEDKEALMYPYINDALGPREDDIKKIQALYGKRISDANKK